MPIKLPKGFPRRKSSGNVLDEVSSSKEHGQSESTSSFKVLARPQSMGKSLDGNSAINAIENRPRPPPKSSFEIDNEELFSVVRHDAPNRSSDTTNSLTTLPNDSTASSRYSNSSTNPSSVDSGSSRNVKPTGQRYYEDNTGAQGHSSKPSFLKNAGRTFSFGIGKHNQSRDMTDLPPPVPTHRATTSNVHQRERSMTESSVSTAAPPRLDDHTFSIKASADDDFGNMFAHMNTKSSRENLSSSRPTPTSQSAQRNAPPRPIHANKNATIETSLPSWSSPGSRDGLMGSSSPARTVIHDSPNFSKPSTLRNITMDTIRSEESMDDNVFENTPLQRSPESAVVKPYTSPRARAPPSAFPTTVMGRARTQSTGNSSIQKSDAGSEYEQPAFDPALLANAHLATQYESKAQQVQQTPQSKVMTPAEFERYRQQKEDTRKYNKVFGKADSDDGSGDDYDDDEEDDREREQAALKQRKKQEAHLAVYRQQMMKVTGDAIPGVGRPGSSSAAPANSSQLDLSLQERRMSQMTLNPNASQYRLPPVDIEPEEDEDVPLGILAAHGFPNKNKPPSRLLGSASNPNLRNLAQTQGGGSVVGDASNRGSLPAFARHLPVDPYYGASIVHQAERAPLAMHGNMSSPHLATQPQPSGAATAHPLHPAGLVGVIAGEERARAMRRGSPNAQSGQFDMPQAPPNMRPQMNPYQQPGMMMPQQAYSPAEQAQLQMSQNMTQMMQMQMQWMQQMSSMMGSNPNMPMTPMMGMPGMLGMPGMPGMPQQMPQMQQNGMPIMTPPPQHPGLPHRPQSVPLQGQLPTHRTMSSLSPSMSGWNASAPVVPQFNPGGSVYAHSIAPSERSNVGLASRYRPVTTGQPEPEQPSWQKRSSTFSSATFRPWTNGPTNAKPSVPTIRSVNQQNDDDDDEQGWAEMKARKETKQKSWRLRKGGNNTLKELYNAPA